MAQGRRQVSPQVARQLIELFDLARQMRQVVYGGGGVPEWGKDAEFVITRLTEVIEIIEKAATIVAAKHFRGASRQSRE